MTAQRRSELMVRIRHGFRSENTWKTHILQINFFQVFPGTGNAPQLESVMDIHFRRRRPSGKPLQVCATCNISIKSNFIHLLHIAR